MQFRRDLATSYNNVGYTLTQMGKEVEGIEACRKSVVIFEALAAANPANVVAQRDLAACYSYVGDVYKNLAAKAAALTAKRVEHWREARTWYQRSLKLTVEMRDHGLLRGSDASATDKLIGEIADCDAALAKLR